MKQKKIDKYKNIISNLDKLDYSSLEQNHGYVLTGSIGGFNAAIDKVKNSFVKQVILGIMGGIILGIAFVACIQATKGIKTEGIKNLIMGIMFPGGIILISFLGGGLYTSHCFAALPVIKKSISSSDYIKALIGVFIGNFVGTFFIALFISLMNFFKDSTYWDIAIKKLLYIGANGEIKITFKNAVLCFVGVFVAGILCNFLVAGTLPLSFASKNAAASILVMFFAILFFVASGFQHSPANTFFFWVLLLDPAFSNIHKGHEYYFLIFLALNIVPAALGNFIGGGIILPYILYSLNSKVIDLLFKKHQIELLQCKIKKYEEVK